MLIRKRCAVGGCFSPTVRCCHDRPAWGELSQCTPVGPREALSRESATGSAAKQKRYI